MLGSGLSLRKRIAGFLGAWERGGHRDLWAIAGSCVVEVEDRGRGAQSWGSGSYGLGKAPRKGHPSRVLKDTVGRGNEQSRPCLVKPGAQERAV